MVSSEKKLKGKVTDEEGTLKSMACHAVPKCGFEDHLTQDIVSRLQEVLQASPNLNSTG